MRVSFLLLAPLAVGKCVLKSSYGKTVIKELTPKAVLIFFFLMRNHIN